MVSTGSDLRSGVPSVTDPNSPYNAPGGHPPPPYGSHYQAGSPEERTWILISHFGGAAAAFFGGTFVGWLPPLAAYLARGDRSPIVRAESLKALNFQLTWTIVGVIG